MGGLTLIRLKCYVPPKPIAFQIASYDLILNELRGDFPGKLKLIGWHYCHSLCSTESWLISLQKKKLELSVGKEVFASLFWALVAENPCRRQERGRTFTADTWTAAAAASRVAPWLKVPAWIFSVSDKKQSLSFFFLFFFCLFSLIYCSLVSSMVLLAEQCSHFFSGASCCVFINKR